DDPDAFVRNRAAVVVGRMAGASAEELLASEAVAQKVSLPARVVGLALVGTETAVVKALGMAIAAGGVEMGRAVLGHEDPGLRSAFFEAIRIQDPDRAALEAADPGFVAQFAMVLRADVDVASRAIAVEAVGQVKSPLATEVLADALAYDPNAGIRVRAAQGLSGRAAEPRAADAMKRAIGDPDPAVATIAIRALKGNGDPQVLDALFRRIGAAAQPVREAVEEVLAETHREDLLPFVDRMMGLDQPE